MPVVADTVAPMLLILKVVIDVAAELVGLVSLLYCFLSAFMPIATSLGIFAN